MRRFIHSPSVYDVDAEHERQKQALLKYINAMRAQRPGFRPTAGQAFLFFAKCLVSLALLLVVGFMVWIWIVEAFSL